MDLSNLNNEPMVRSVIPGYPNYFLTPDGVWSYWEARRYGRPWCRLKETDRGRYSLYNVEDGTRARATLKELEQAVATGTSPSGAPHAPKLSLTKRIELLEARVEALEAGNTSEG